MAGRPGCAPGLPAERGRKHGEWLLHRSVSDMFYHRIEGLTIARVDSHSSRVVSEFELGLEFDSAEVRGVLMYDGREWGKVVFDFIS